MVNSQLRTGGVVDKVVLAAFLEVPRQRFVAPEHESLAYLDREFPARGAKFRRLLAPMVLARMLQAATVVAGDRALDVAGGSGYGAAILDGMGAKVVLLESDAGAAEAAKSRASRPGERRCGRGPLDSGAAALAPFDLIVVEGAFGRLPRQSHRLARRSGTSRRHRRVIRLVPGGRLREKRRGGQPEGAVRDQGGPPRWLQPRVSFAF